MGPWAKKRFRYGFKLFRHCLPLHFLGLKYRSRYEDGSLHGPIYSTVTRLLYSSFFRIIYSAHVQVVSSNEDLQTIKGHIDKKISPLVINYAFRRQETALDMKGFLSVLIFYRFNCCLKFMNWIATLYTKNVTYCQ